MGHLFVFSLYVEEGHQSLVATLIHMRVPLGTCEGMWHRVKEHLV